MASTYIFGNHSAVHQILIDYEDVSHQAIQNILPNAIIYGSNFHFGQALIREMHSEGLQ